MSSAHADDEGGGELAQRAWLGRVFNLRSLQRALAQYETKHAILDENLQFWMEQKQNRMAMGRSAPRPRPANV